MKKMFNILLLGIVLLSFVSAPVSVNQDGDGVFNVGENGTFTGNLDFYNLVTGRNVEGYLYVSGEPNIDGSLRFALDEDTNFTIVEKRVSGIWEPSSIVTGPNSVWVGRAVGVGAIGHHLITEATDGHVHYHVHSTFDAESGLTTADASVTYAYENNIREIFQPDNSTTFTGSLLEYTFPSPSHIIGNNIYYQTGPTAATDTVRIQIYKGTNISGALVFDQKYPASQFPASSEVEAAYHGYVEYDEGETYFLKYTSDADFSFKMDSTNTVPWLAADISYIREDNLLQTKPWINNTSYSVGQYLINNRTIMISNDSSVQTGSFESNLDKWYNIASRAAMNFWTKVGDVLSFSGDVDIGGDLDINGSLNVSDDVEVGGDLNVSGDITTDGSLFQASQPSDAGLIYAMDFEQYGIGKTQYDKSPNSLTTIAIGGPTVSASSGFMGSGVYFDEDWAHYFKTDDNLGITGNVPFTIQFRAKFESLPGATWHNTLLTIGTGTNSSVSLRAGYATNEYYLASGTTTWDTGEVIDLLWHQHTVTYDGTDLEWFVDGVYIGSTTIALTIVDAQLLIGVDSIGGSYRMDGNMSNIKIWDRLLTADEWRVVASRDIGDSVVTSDGFKVVDTNNNILLDVDSDIGVTATDMYLEGSLYQNSQPSSVGLIYSMDFEQLNSTAQYDKSPSSLTTTVYDGATVNLTNGFMDGGIDFNGSSYAMSDENLGISGDDPWTVQFRAKIDSPHDDTMLTMGIGGNNGIRFAVGYGAKYYSRVATNTDWQTGIAVDTDWHQHTITYNGTEIEWFLDGVSISTYPYTLNIPVGPVTMGKPGAGNYYYMDGKMSNVKIWDRALAEDEWRVAASRDMGDSVVTSDSFKILNMSDSIVMEVNSTGVVLNDGDLIVNNNITLGQRITFALGGSIQNIVSGWFEVSGSLNVSDDLVVGGNISFEDKLTTGEVELDLTKYLLGTGVLEGGIISKNASNDSILDVTAGAGVFVNYSDINNPVVEHFTWPAQTFYPNVNGYRSKWVGFQRNSTGGFNLISQIEFTQEEKRTVAVIGRCISTDGLDTCNVPGKYVTPAFGDPKSMEDLFWALGSISINGNLFSANGSNMLLDRSSGYTFRFSASFGTTPNSPNVHFNDASLGIIDYAYHLQDSIMTTKELEIDPDNYDLNGVKTTVPNNKWTLQELWFFPVSRTTHILYGQDVYNSKGDATQAISSEQKIRNEEVLDGAILRGYLVIREGATDLSDADEATFYEAGVDSAGGTYYWEMNGVLTPAESVNVLISNNFTVNGTFHVDVDNERVGIGTTSPESILHIYENTTDYESGGLIIEQAGDDNAIIEFLLTDGMNYGVGISYAEEGWPFKISGEGGSIEYLSLHNETFYVPANVDLDIDNATLFVNSTSDYVGIGIGSPSAELDVVGDTELNGDLIVTATDSITLDNTNTAGEINLVLGSDTTATSFNVQSNSLTDLFTILGQGHVGIGGVPESRMDIYQHNNLIGLRLRGTTPGTQIGDIYMQQDGRMVFDLSSSGEDSPYFDFQGGDFAVDTDVFYVNSTSDRVGIGTTNTDATLTVNGSYLQTPTEPVLAGVLIDGINFNVPQGVYVSGKYAYVIAEASDSLSIIDISDPSAPTLTGALIESSNMRDAAEVYVSGKYAYVASSFSDSLSIIDISDPSAPTFAGVLKDSTNMNGAESVYVSGKYAYVASYESDSLAIVDISDTSSPILVGSLLNSTNMEGARSVYVSGKYAYVASLLSDSLTIIDISNPSAPILTASLSNSTNMNGAESVYVSGKYAYVASFSSDSLTIVDISNSTSPTITGVLIDSTNLNAPRSVQVSGKYAYVAGSSSDSLAIVDISDSSSPVFVSGLDDSTNMDGAYSVYVSGKYAYVTSRNANSLAVIDIGGIDSPSASIGDMAVSTLDVSENLDVANDLSIGSGLSVGIGGIYSAGGMAIDGAVDVYAGDMSLVGSLNDSINMETATSVYISGKYAYVAGLASDSLAIIDISDPSNPTFTGSLIDSSNLNNARSVHVSGGYAYVLGRAPSSLAIIDISNPSSPTLTGVLKDSSMDHPLEVYISGKYAYVLSDSSDSFTVVDISDPTSPIIVGSFSGGVNMTGSTSLYVLGKYAYVTAWDVDSLTIIDISDPTSPTLAGNLLDSVNMLGPEGVYVSGKYAYVVGYDYLAAIDISDPSNPTFTGRLRDPANIDSARSIYVSGKYAYIVEMNSDSFTIIDISDPTSPIFIGSLTDSINMDIPYSVYVSGKYAYVASLDSDSLAIIDIGGIDAPSASIGALAVSNLDVSDNLDVFNDLSVGSGISVGGKSLFNGDVAIDGSVDIIYGNLTMIGDDSDMYFMPQGNGHSQSLIFYEDLVAGETEKFRMEWADNSGDGQMLFTGDANVFFANTVGDGYYFEHAGGGGTNADENYIMHFDTTDYIGTKPYGSDADIMVGERNPHGLMNSGAYGALYMRTGSVGENNAFYMQKEGTNWAELFQLNLDGSANFTDIWQSGGTSESLYTPESVASFNVGDNPEEIIVIGKYAYIIESGSSLLRVVDINDPSNPALVSTTSTGISSPEFFDVKGNFAYVIDALLDELVIIDIVDPSSPFIASTKGLSKTDPTAIDVVGGYAYLVDSSDKKLKVYNVMNPQDIETLDEISLSGAATSIEVIGSYAYITSFGGTADLEIVDVSDPEALGMISATDFGIDIGSMDVSGNYVYVTENDEVPREFIIIDATNVTAPVIVSNTSIMDNTQAPRDLIVSDGYAYMVTSTDNDLLVWDVSDPTDPQLIGYRALAATPKGIEISGKNVYITEAGTQDDLEIIDVSGIEVQSARIHSLEAGTVSIFNDMYADANVNIKGGLDVGIGGIHAESDIISGKNMIALNRIGVGTETPLGMLDLMGTASTEPNIYMTDTTFFNEFRLHTGNNAVNFRVDDINLISDSRFQWYVDGTEVMQLDNGGNIELDGTVITDNYCGVTSSTFTAEENAALNDATYEWSFGDGATGTAIKSIQPCNGTVTAISWSCATNGTNTDIDISIDAGGSSGCNCIATGSSCFTDCVAIDFVQGEGLQGYTNVAGGASNCVMTWWVRYD